jgi:hypothetical protein
MLIQTAGRRKQDRRELIHEEFSAVFFPLGLGFLRQQY